MIFISLAPGHNNSQESPAIVIVLRIVTFL